MGPPARQQNVAALRMRMEEAALSQPLGIELE
jgi:hypothetical protein